MNQKSLSLALSLFFLHCVPKSHTRNLNYSLGRKLKRPPSPSSPAHLVYCPTFNCRDHVKISLHPYTMSRDSTSPLPLCRFPLQNYGFPPPPPDCGVGFCTRLFKANKSQSSRNKIVSIQLHTPHGQLPRSRSQVLATRLPRLFSQRHFIFLFFPHCTVPTLNG